MQYATRVTGIVWTGDKIGGFVRNRNGISLLKRQDSSHLSYKPGKWWTQVESNDPKYAS